MGIRRQRSSNELFLLDDHRALGGFYGRPLNFNEWKVMYSSTRMSVHANKPLHRSAWPNIIQDCKIHSWHNITKLGPPQTTTRRAHIGMRCRTCLYGLIRTFSPSTIIKHQSLLRFLIATSSYASRFWTQSPRRWTPVVLWKVQKISLFSVCRNVVQPQKCWPVSTGLVDIE